MEKPEASIQKPGAVTLVCFALKEESAPFQKMVAGRLGISVLITGIGRKNAEKAVREFLDGHSGGASVPASRLVSSLAPPDYVLTCGFAGGLNPDLKLGEVVFEIVPRSSRGDEAQINNQSEPPYVGCYDTLLAAVAKPAKFYCADRIATTVEEKMKLRADNGADAVEMESAAIHAVCR